MNNKAAITGVIFGASAIVLGAFGAHGLKELLDDGQIAVFETGVKYQMYHALFLLFVSLVPVVTDKAKKAITILVITGVLLFSFSLYFLSCNDLFSFDFKKIGFVTPIGGLLLIAAWTVLFLNLLKRK